MLFPTEDGLVSVAGPPNAGRPREEVRTMLVITRREGEEVVIGNPAAPLGVVRIAQIKGDRVRIAFEFPREVEVHRREVAEQIASSEHGSAPPVVGTIRPAAEGS